APIISFRGIRYAHSGSTKLGGMLAPPYDVISTKQKKELLQPSPFNVIRLIIGNPSHETHKTSDYQSARKAFKAWREKEILKREKASALYVYRQNFVIHGKTYHRTGFIGL